MTIRRLDPECARRYVIHLLLRPRTLAVAKNRGLAAKCNWNPTVRSLAASAISRVNETTVSRSGSAKRRVETGIGSGNAGRVVGVKIEGES